MLLFDATREPVVAWEKKYITPSKVLFENSFELDDYHPICVPLRRTLPKHERIIDAEIDVMLEAGVIARSNSPWGFVLVVVTKKGGTPRVCVDLRALYKRMKKD